MGLLAVSIDLDEVDCYTAIHGVDCPNDPSAHSVYLRTLPRLSRFFEDLDIGGVAVEGQHAQVGGEVVADGFVAFDDHHVVAGLDEAFDRRADLSVSGRARAAELTWRSSAERTLSVYRELVA